jgi:transcriptional regulator with XRE-family HTH domain
LGETVTSENGAGPAEPEPGTNPSAELARLLRSWRERLDPKAVPGLAENYARRKKSHVSQEDIARLIGASSVWYGKLERGERAQYSDDFLDRTAIALRLSENERMMLYLYSVGREPASREHHSDVVVTPSMEQIVRRQPWPAYISDGAWEIVAFNDMVRDWFPWVLYERNLMRWVFTYPEARHQLYNWETDWAPAMLAQMRVANARRPENMRLARLIREILAVSEEAHRLWVKEPTVHVHPDGDRRGLRLPGREEVITVEIIALAPLRASEFRFVLLIPV